VPRCAKVLTTWSAILTVPFGCENRVRIGRSISLRVRSDAPMLEDYDAALGGFANK